MENDVLGRIAPNSTPVQADMIAYQGVVPKVGDYVVIEGDESDLLGMVSNVVRGALELERSDLLQANYYDTILKVVGSPSDWLKATIRIIGKLVSGDLSGLPRAPPPTGALVRRAPAELLQRIFAPPSGKEGIKLGKLMTREDVTVHLDPDELISRHLAVLAVTGGGKSNSVAVILEEIVRMGGVAILFDVHSEYAGMSFDCPHCEVEVVDPVLDPNTLSTEELGNLMRVTYDSAPKQFIYLKGAFRNAKELLIRERLGEYLEKAEIEAEMDDLLAGIHAIIKLSLYEGRDADDPYLLAYSPNDKSSIESLLAKVDFIRSKYGGVLRPTAGELADHLNYGKLVIVDLGQLDSDLTDVVVGKTLFTILHRAKAKRTGRGYLDFPTPVLAVLEEAHALIPSAEYTYTSQAAASIAKEGRKFGVGLCLVSQRPKRLNSDVLSQMVNKIILRVVEPEDQAYVRRATEFLSEEMTSYLPSLSVGEAVVVGPMVRIPALVKVRLFEGKRGGESLRAYEMWREGLEKRISASPDEYYRSIGG